MKAPSPILVTEFGIVIDVRPIQSWKTLSPILVTSVPIVTLLKEERLGTVSVILETLAVQQ
jgi:hypothetical protein